MIKIDDKYKREHLMQRSADDNKLDMFDKKHEVAHRQEARAEGKIKEVSRGQILLGFGGRSKESRFLLLFF